MREVVPLPSLGTNLKSVKLDDAYQIVINFENRKLQMVGSESSLGKFEGEESNRKLVGSRLLMISLLYLVFQLAIDWSGNVFFSSNLEISRSIHSVFVGMENVTPALIRLKNLYGRPIGGREFSQVFAIYFFLLALLCLYLIALFGFLFTRKVRSRLRPHRMSGRDYAVLFMVFALGLWGVYFFCVGPPTSLGNYRGMFGTDFIGSVCLLLPMAQFLIVAILVLFYVLGGSP